MAYEYGNTWGRLLTETALVAFFKRDGSARLMLCTRNIDTCMLMWNNSKLRGLLDGFDNRCSIRNGNIAVVDLAIGDCRSFSIERTAAIKWLGEIDSKDKIEHAIDEYEQLRKQLEQEHGHTVTGGEAKKLTSEGKIDDSLSAPVIF